MRLANNIDLLFDKAINLAPSKGKWKSVATHLFRYVGKSELNWDPWILKDGDIYRLFYLRSSNGSIVKSWWDTPSKIYGAISSDMQHWEDVGMLLDIESVNNWESGRLCAGSTYKENGIYYLFYSAADKGGMGQQANKGDKVTESIGLAISSNGINWQRLSSNPCLKADDNNCWYGRSTNAVFNYFHWRDPFIFKDHKDGKYYMFFSAYSKQGGYSKHVGGCIGLAVADNMAGPYELLPPAATPVIDGTCYSPFLEMERPQVIYQDGKYHLFTSTFLTSVNSGWREKVGKDKITDSTLYRFVSDRITGPYLQIPNQPTVVGSEKTGMYGVNFFPTPDNESEYFAYGWYYRIFTLGISGQYRVRWYENSIEIV